MDTLERLVADPSAWAALATLIAMEIVLGVDNLVFIAILANRVDQSRRAFARILGLSLALVFRLGLLAFAAEIVHLKEPLATVYGHPFSARDLLLLAGGLFLVWKATGEIHERVDPNAEEEGQSAAPRLGVAAALIQIVMIDIVFSVDSIITAVGMTGEFPIMVIAVVVAVVLMMVASGPLGQFVQRNPTVLMLALELPFDDRHDADRRRLRLPHRKGLYLRGDVLFVAGRGAEHPRPAQNPEISMTLGSLVLFAAVYFAAVATPGPGLAALVARVIAYGLAGVAPFIAGYVVGDMIWLVVAGTGLAALANAFAGAFTAIKYAGAAYLLYSRLAHRDRAGRARRGAAARLAGLARLLRFAVADARQPEGHGVLSVDHAAGGRREEPDAAPASRADGGLRSRASPRPSRPTRSPQTGRARCSARPRPCGSSTAPPAG